MPQTEFQHFRSLISECSDKPKPSKTHQKALLSARAHQNTLAPKNRLVSPLEGIIKPIRSRSRGGKLQPAYRQSVIRKHEVSPSVADVFLLARRLLHPAAAASGEQQASLPGASWNSLSFSVNGRDSAALYRRHPSKQCSRSGSPSQQTRTLVTGVPEFAGIKSCAKNCNHPKHWTKVLRPTIPVTCNRDFCLLVKAFAF